MHFDPRNSVNDQHVLKQNLKAVNIVISNDFKSDCCIPFDDDTLFFFYILSLLIGRFQTVILGRRKTCKIEILTSKTNVQKKKRFFMKYSASKYIVRRYIR